MGGRDRPAALEDALEALIGAIYSDSDFPTARTVVLRLYGDLSARLNRVIDSENPKGRLQERVQPVLGNGALRYEVDLDQSDPDALSAAAKIRSGNMPPPPYTPLTEEEVARFAAWIEQGFPA